MSFIAQQSYKIDLTPQGGYVVVYVSQHDNSAREIVFKIYNQGQVFNIPANINVSVQGVKSNSGYFTHNCTYSGNLVMMPITDDMTDVIGKAVCVLKFTNSSQKKLATAKFILNVDSDSSSEGIIIDTVAEEIFDQLMDEIRAQATAININIATLQSMVGTPLIAATAAGMTDHNKIYVYTGDETGYTYGNWYYWDGTEWQSGGQYNSVPIVIDQTPTSGNVNPVSSNGVYIALETKVDKVFGKGLSTEDYTTDEKTKLAGLVSGLSEEAKVALLACFEHVAWIDDHGQDYYDALYSALYNSSGLGYAWSAVSGVAPLGMTYESIAFAIDNEYATITKPVLFAGYGDKEVEIEMAVVSGGSTDVSIGVVDKYNYGCRLTFSSGNPMLIAEHDNHLEKAYVVYGIDITQFNKYSISLNNSRVTFKINDVIISTGNSYRNAYWGQPIISPSNPVMQNNYALVANIKSIRYNNHGVSNNKKVLKYYRNKGVVIGASELENNTKRITTDLLYFPATHQVTVRLVGVVENDLQFTIKIIDQNGNVWQASNLEEYSQGFFESDLPVIPRSQSPILWTNTEDELTTATLKRDTATEWTYGRLRITNGTLRILFADGQSTNDELNRAISGSVFVNGEEYVLEEGVY